MPKDTTEPDRLQAGIEQQPDPSEEAEMSDAFEEAMKPTDPAKPTRKPSKPAAVKKAKPAAPAKSAKDDDGDDDGDEGDPDPNAAAPAKSAKDNDEGDEGGQDDPGDGDGDGEGAGDGDPDLDTRLADIEKRYDKDGDGGAAQPPPPPPPPPPPVSRSDAASGDIEQRLMSAIELPDEIMVGDKKVNVREFETDFPEESAYVKAAVQAAAKALAREFRGFGEDVEEMRYWSEIQAVHPDARKVGKSDAFNQWLDKQPAPMRRASLTMNSADAVTILDAFQAQARTAAADRAKEPLRDARDRRTAIHRGTLRGPGTGAPSSRAGGSKDPNEEFENVFNGITKG